MRFLVCSTALLVGCAHALPPSMVPADMITVTTEDGWVEQVRHYPGDGPPVLMVHGMGANHYNWDYREEVSLAASLQKKGWDVWVPELRGDPGSVAPNRKAARDYDFDDHAKYDLPAIVDGVLDATGETQLYWVGHSMGGMLLYTALTQYPEKVRAGVAVCSPGTFDNPNKMHKQAARVGWLLGGPWKIHTSTIARATSGLGNANPLLSRIGNVDNLDPAIVTGMARDAMVDVPRPMARQAVMWLKNRAFTDTESHPWLVPSDTPLLMMGGAIDRVVSEPDVALTCSRYPNCQYVRLGVSSGYSLDYGHVDPVMGKSAATEVWPVIERFLESQRDQALAEQAEPDQVPSGSAESVDR